jgi:alpha-tubulin suppressor-like RCC1 family protein
VASRIVFTLLSLVACTPRGAEQPEPSPRELVEPAKPELVVEPPPAIAEPTPLVGLTMIAAGVHHTCALEDGRVLCWGLNRFDILGVGPGLPDYVTSPRPVIGLEDAGPIVEVATDYDFSCARAQDGAVYCWGDNDRGQLGVGDLVRRDRPTRIPELDASALVLGFEHACALTKQGKRGWCWGQGFSTSPLAVAELTGVDALVSPAGHRCTLTAGAMRCWGQNSSGEIGNGEGGCEYDEPLCDHCRRLPDRTCKHVEKPTAPLGLPNIAKIAAGGSHTYALDREGRVWQWGQTGVTMSYGERPNYRPQLVAELPPSVVEISAGSSHVCARTEAGELWCWGNNSFGQLGFENDDPRRGGERPSPHQVEGLPPATQIAAGFHFTCAITGEGPDSQAWCWGDNGTGQLGDGTEDRRHAPTLVRAAVTP